MPSPVTYPAVWPVSPLQSREEDVSKTKPPWMRDVIVYQLGLEWAGFWIAIAWLIVEKC